MRVIGRLDIKGPNLVKGVHLEGLRVLGQPEHFARFYAEQGADELLYMDVVASLYGRNSLNDMIERTAHELFIPLTVGGGIRTLDDIAAVLRSGADKVAVNTAALANPVFVTEAARRFGSSTIVISIEAMQLEDGSYEAYTDNGRERSGKDAFEWATEVVERGAGELMVTSIAQEGTGKGFDCELTRHIAKTAPVPVIACGGAGCSADVVDVIENGCADAVALASMLHYAFVEQAGQDIDALGEGNTEYLRSGHKFTRVQPTTIAAVKEELAKHGISAGRETEQV